MTTYYFEIYNGSAYLCSYACNATCKNQAWEIAYKWATETYPTRAPRIIFKN